jgi:hypothetical protein
MTARPTCWPSRWELATVLKEIQEADLGPSVGVSGLLGPVHEMCCKLGMMPAPHTVEHSLGVWGKVEEATKRLAEPCVCAASSTRYARLIS